eukprot:gene10168-biopygen13827
MGAARARGRARPASILPTGAAAAARCGCSCDLWGRLFTAGMCRASSTVRRGGYRRMASGYTGAPGGRRGRAGEAHGPQP